MDEIEQIHGRHGRRERSDSWEKAGLEALWPVLEPRIRRDVEAWPWIPSCLGTQRPEAGVFGFFLYEWRDTGDGQESLLLHMGNSLAPRSPFEDLGTRANELLRVLDSAEKARPDAKRLVSETWLNSFGAFLRLFPPDWSRNPAAGELGHAFDWWGQFVTRRGSYHKPNGDFLRTTGCFRYPSVSLGCDVQALRRHLEHSFAP